MEDQARTRRRVAGRAAQALGVGGALAVWAGQKGPQQLIAAVKGEYQQLLDRPRPGKR